MANNEQEVKELYYRVRLYMIGKAIEGLITKTPSNKIKLYQG